MELGILCHFVICRVRIPILRVHADTMVSEIAVDHAYNLQNVTDTHGPGVLPKKYGYDFM